MSERFTPSDLQAKAIREIKDWFLRRTAEQQVFRVFGYAGTGKTTHHPARDRGARARYHDEERETASSAARTACSTLPSPAKRRWS